MVLVFLACNITALAQDDTTGAMRGDIKDAFTGEPLSFSMVMLVNTNYGAAADEDGKYIIRKIPAGTYSVVCYVSGYMKDTIFNVVIENNRTTYLNIEMRPACCEPPPNPYRPLERITRRRRTLLVAGGETVIAASTLIGLNQLWYKQYPRSSFHVFNDNDEWLQMDKAGHAYTAYTAAFISSRWWYWTGKSTKRGAWISGITAFAYQSSIEVMDGFSTGWGFSWGDIAANGLGSAAYISQVLGWHEIRIEPKFGFRPSGLAPYRPELLGKNTGEQILKDYNGQTYWLSVNVASFLSEETRFPHWLNVAVGYGANGMTGGSSNPVMYNDAGNEITFSRYRQFYLSLDIDTYRLKVKSRFLRVILHSIGMIKIPAPGIELSRNGVRPLLFAF